MNRKPSSFDAFMEEVEAETRAAGPRALAEARSIRDHFRLAAQVLRRRRELGLTQRQLAEAVGVHQSEISDIERGASTPGYRTLVKLAFGLQAEVAFVPWSKEPAARAARARRAVARRAPRTAVMARRVAAKAR
jgi:transcriptional regulator with XRE-family HTH domain